MEDRDKVEFSKSLRLPDDSSKNRKNFTQGYYYREIGRFQNAVPSEFQLAAEEKLINKTAYEEVKCQLPDSPRATFLMVFSPDGKKVASTHGNHNVYVTDLTTGKNIQTLSGHPRTPWCIAFHPSSNQILASGCLGGQVRVWDLHGGSEVWTTESQTVIASLAFHPVDRMLVIATYNELHFWDWSQPQPFAKCSTKSGREKVRYVSFDRLGNKLITGIANPVNVPSQWDRINVVSGQPLLSSSTTSTTSTSSTTFNSTPPSTVPSSQPAAREGEQGRSLTSWYRNFVNRYNQLDNIYRTIPTIDRGTDPMDLIDLRNSRTNSNTSTSNPTPSTSTSTSQANSSSPLRFKITRSACRSYRRLERNMCRERFRIHSSVFRRLGSRAPHSTGSPSTASTSSTSTSHSSVATNPSTSSTTMSVASNSHIPRLRRCAFNLNPRARSWCLTLSPENSHLFSARSTQSTAATGAVTNPTFTSYPGRGIFSTRESSSSNHGNQPSSAPTNSSASAGSNENSRASQRDTQSEPERGSSNEQISNPRLNSERKEEQRTRANLNTDSGESSRSNRDLRRRSPERGAQANREPPRGGEIFRNRPSVFQLIPVNMRNVSPGRRFRDEANSDGELTEHLRGEDHSLSHSLMHPRPVPRFQVRSRLFQDQQSQLHLLTNRETHGLNLQNNQILRRQLSFRPGGQFVLSRHSNSPFQPRVPNQTDGSVQGTSTATQKSNRNDAPGHRPSFNSSESSDVNNVGTSASSAGNAFSSSSVATNLSFTGESSCHQLPDQINRRLYDRVKMMLRDRIRNSSENAATDSTVNYSRISGESEAERDPLYYDESLASRGLGPRGADPMLSSADETLEEMELMSSTRNTIALPINLTGAPSNPSNSSEPNILDAWEAETEATYSMRYPLPMNDVLNEQPQPAAEPARNESHAETEQQQPSRSSDSSAIYSSYRSTPEYSMRKGIELLSLHIENMQRLCWARMEILQLQKIKRMWEDLTVQIRQFHNIIRNRSSGENSTVSNLNENSNSGSDVPNMSALAISTSPVPERNSEGSTSVENSNDANTDSNRNNYSELVENQSSENHQQQPPKNSSSNLCENSNDSFARRATSSNAEERVNNLNSAPSRNEVEEPQPGPSGLSNHRTSESDRDSILQLEYRVYRLLRDIIQKNRRRKEENESSVIPRSSFQRHCLPSMSRSTLFSKLRSRGVGREFLSLLDALKYGKSGEGRSSRRSRSTGADWSQPSTSTRRPSSSSDACLSCGQKRRSAESSSGSAASSSGPKLFRNNAGGRSKAPKKANTPKPSSSGASTSGSGRNSSNDLLRQMLQTMEMMLNFQRRVFKRSEHPTGDSSSRQSPGDASSEDDDSDDDDERIYGIGLRESSLRGASDRDFQHSIINTMNEITQFKANKVLGFMVKSLNQFFGENFRNIDEVVDEQILGLYMLLDLALELTSLLLEQLTVRRHTYMRGSTENGVGEGNSLSPRSSGSGRARDRNRRPPHVPHHSTRDDNSRSRSSANSSRLQTNLISTRNSSSTASTSDRNSTGAQPSSLRRKRTSSSGLPRWHNRRGRTPQGSNSSHSASSSRPTSGTSPGSRSRSLWADRQLNSEDSSEIRAVNPEINNNRNNNDTNNRQNDANSNRNNDSNNNRNNDTNNNRNSYQNNYYYSVNYTSDNVNNNSSNRNNGSGNSSNNSNNSSNSNRDRRSNNSNNITPNSNARTSNNVNNESTVAASSSIEHINNNTFLNYYFPNTVSSTNSGESGNNIIIVAGLSTNNENRNIPNNPAQGVSNVTLNPNALPPLRSMELTLARNESGDLSLRDERPIFWIRYGGNNEAPGPLNGGDAQPRVSSFTVPVVQVNDVPVSDVSMPILPRNSLRSPVPRVSEDIWRWRAWRPRFLHPRYGGPNPFDDQDPSDLPDNIHYYRVLSSVGSYFGVYTLDPMIITETPLSPHHRIQAWDFSKMKIPDISDREANGVVAECKIHNDASVDVSNDGHLLVTLLPSGRLSVTTMLGVYSLDWSSLGQLLYRTSFEQNAVSVSLSPTNRHLLVGLASRPVVLRDRTNMAQIFRMEGGRPCPLGGSWQSGRGRLVHIRDLEQTREMTTMSLNCIRWAPGAGQGLVYGTNTGQLKVLR